MIHDLLVIGGGAGGCFAAIRVAELHPGAKIGILEAARHPLSKVAISGGGRCNVTHACFDPEKLIGYYPRGHQVLLKPFRRFQPRDIVKWFERKGIRLKTEPDGRIFPVSDQSDTIIRCFLQAMQGAGIRCMTSTRALRWFKQPGQSLWQVETMDGQSLTARFLLISAGSDQRTWDELKRVGHTVVYPVPSLFTFQIRDSLLTDLQGISLPEVRLTVPRFQLEASGPLLITHWGLSGPAVLKLSAWGARDLFQAGYVFDLKVQWWPDKTEEEIMQLLRDACRQNPKKQVHNLTFGVFPSRLWKYSCVKAGIPEKVNGSEVGTQRLAALAKILSGDRYRVTGKSAFKEEFVTAGGIALDEIDFDSFESRLLSGLYLVGEVLDIDALTGGFNFQAAWTGAAIAAEAISKRL